MKARRLTVLLVTCILFGLGAATAAAASLSEKQQEPPHSVYLPSVGNAFRITPVPTPTPDAVYIASVHGYHDDWMYQVYAELANGHSEDVCDVSVAGKFYNSSGAVIAQASGSAMLDRLANGQKAPVHLTVYTSANDIAGYALEAPKDYSCFGSPQNVAVLTQNVRDNGGVEVYGEVRNDTTEPLSSIAAVATFYDDYGGIWYAENGRLQGEVTLAPGERGAYNILTYDADLFGRPFTVQAEGGHWFWKQ